jgi:hypothetical protein
LHRDVRVGASTRRPSPRVVGTSEFEVNGRDEMKPWCTFKIERLSYADGRRIAEADVPEELLALQSCGTWDGLHIFPDAEPVPDGHSQFPRISTGWGGQGYVLQCFETAQSNSFILSTSSEIASPEVYIDVGGMTQELWPKQLFVPYDMALQALLHFLATGLQDPKLCWVGLSSFPRKTIKRRSK